MSKDLVQIQRHLKSESNLLPSGDYSSIYNNEKPIGPRQKNISYLPVPGVGVENSDSLYDKDEKSLSQGLHEYADLMNQMIDNKSPPAQESHSIIDIEQIDLQGGKEQQSGSSRSKKGAEKRSSSHTEVTTNKRSTSVTKLANHKGKGNKVPGYVPIRQDRSGSSMRSLTGLSAGYHTVKPQKKAKPSRKEKLSSRLANKENAETQKVVRPKLSTSRARKSIKRREHNFSTSSQQIPKQNIVSLAKVLPDKVQRRKKTPQKSLNDSHHPRLEVSAERQQSTGKKRQDSTPRSKSSKTRCRAKSSTSEPAVSKPKRTDGQHRSCESGRTRMSRDRLQKQVLLNQQKLLKAIKPQSQRPSSTSNIQKYQTASAQQLQAQRSSSNTRPKNTTMNMSSSKKSFPANLLRASSMAAAETKSVKRIQCKTSCVRRPKSNSNQLSPSQFKKVLIEEVNQLKDRIRDHCRHVSNLSPERSTSKNSRKSVSFSRSRRSARSPRQPRKARIPSSSSHQVKRGGQLSSQVMENITNRLNKKMYATNSFDKNQHAQQDGVHHSLSMFDSEVTEGVPGGLLRHQLSQHLTNAGPTQHHSSAQIPTQKILPLKKVARAARASAAHQATQNRYQQQQQQRDNHASSQHQEQQPGKARLRAF